MLKAYRGQISVPERLWVFVIMKKMFRTNAGPFAQAIGTASAVWMKFYRKKHEAFVGAEDFELILRKRFPWRVKAPTDMPDMQSITYTNAFHELQRVKASCAARRSSCECP